MFLVSQEEHGRLSELQSTTTFFRSHSPLFPKCPQDSACSKNLQTQQPGFPNTNVHLSFYLLSPSPSVWFPFSFSVPLILLHEAAECNVAKGELSFLGETG